MGGFDSAQDAMFTQRGYARKAEDEHSVMYTKAWMSTELNAYLSVVVPTNCDPHAQGRVNFALAEEIVNRLVHISHAITLTPDGLAQMEKEFAFNARDFVRRARADVGRLTLPTDLEALATTPVKP